MQFRFLPVRLIALVALACLLAAPAAAHDATPTAGHQYVSEQFGYLVSWPAEWSYVTSESELDGYDMVMLVNGDATAYIVITRPGDTPLSEIAGFMIDGPDTDDPAFVPGMTANDAEGNSIEGETADRAWVAMLGNLTGEQVDGFTEFRYGEVRRLEGDLGVGLSLSMPATDFEGNIAPLSALLDGVIEVESATPTTLSR